MKCAFSGHVSTTAAPVGLLASSDVLTEYEMDSTTPENSLETLSRRYSRSLLPLSMAAREIGIKLRTAHNQISKGVFPLPTILRDRRRYVHVEDLAGYIDALRRTSMEHQR